MSQYAKAGEMQNMRMHAVLSPIFEFRSAESRTLLEATLKLCRNIRVYNEIFLEINEQCKHSSQSAEQITELVSVVACDQTKTTTFAQHASLSLESLTIGLSVPTSTTQGVSAYSASDFYPRFGERGRHGTRLNADQRLPVAWTQPTLNNHATVQVAGMDTPIRQLLWTPIRQLVPQTFSCMTILMTM